MPRRPQSGVTLFEMLIVVALVGLLAGIAFPAMSSGLDSLRLNSASDSIVTFFNEGLNRAGERQELVEIAISQADRTLVMHSSEPGFERNLRFPDGIAISRILPELPGAGQEPARRFVLYPDGTVPRFGIEIVNARGAGRRVSVDPITGVPRVETLETAER
jgi:prepilin-type N-terminal cleavage/methylation domain-containing protein